MAVEVERRLRELAPRMAQLDQLRQERDRQRTEVGLAEELLKQLKWTCYQAQEAYDNAAAEGQGLGGFLSRVFSDAGHRREELLAAAEESRATYEAAKDKLKPLKAELANLEAEIAELEAARIEYDAALEARLRSAAAVPGQSHLAQYQEELTRVKGLLERGEQLAKAGSRVESALGRISSSNLFSTRAELVAFQRELCVFILEASSLPREWGLPALPLESDIRMMEPVGSQSRFEAPLDNTSERLADMALFGSGFDPASTRARMRAIANAAGASDDSVRTEGRHQAMQVGIWCRQVAGFLEGLKQVRGQLQLQIQALVTSPPEPAPQG